MAQSPWPRTFDIFKNLDISNFMSLVHGLVEWVPVNTTIQYWQCSVFQWVNRSTLRNLQKWLNRHDPGPLIIFKNLDISNFMSLVHGLVEWVSLNTTIPVLAVYRVPVRQQEHFQRPPKIAQSPWPRTFDIFKNLDISNFMSLVHGLVEWVPVNTTIPVLAV